MLTAFSTLACGSGPNGFAGFVLLLMALVIWAFISLFAMLG